MWCMQCMWCMEAAPRMQVAMRVAQERGERCGEVPPTPSSAGPEDRGVGASTKGIGIGAEDRGGSWD